MDAQVEFRDSVRFDHESIIMLEDDFGYPFYGVMYNASAEGTHFKSLFKLEPGTHIDIKMDDPPAPADQNRCRAQVRWCKELDNHSIFRYGIGVEYC